MDEATPWHRLFGLALIDFFRGTSVCVEPEIDLSQKQQWLDVVLIHKGSGPLSCRLPDGFDNLGPYNLVTFKSFQEALDGWTLCELVGHFVNYRKQVSPSMQELLPESDFRLYAVCVRFPKSLARQVTLMRLQSGVYEVAYFLGQIRVIVVHELPEEEQNALLHLFSAQQNLVRYGATHYQRRSEETSTLLLQLFERYEEVGVMPDALQQLARETIDALLKKLPAEELRKWLSPEERLKGLPAEERLKGLPAEERLKGLSVDEMLAALPTETRAALAKRLSEDEARAKSGE